MILRSFMRLELATYPPAAPLTARPDWIGESGKAGTDLALMQKHALDRFDLRFGICNVLHGGQVLYDEHMAAAFCRAINEWLAKEWLDREPRLRGSILVSLLNPETAVEEIERLAPDRRFVQVLLLATGEMPLGRRLLWPIYRAAEKHGLAIGIHAGSMARYSQTQSGFLSYHAEDYVTQAQGFATQVNSFVAEGVFVKFPQLKVVLIESGVSWLPSLMWRFSKDWRGVRTEIPWIDRAPSSIVRDHIRLTIQPIDGPADPKFFERLVDHLGSDEMLLFSSDYPHWQFDGDAVLPTGVPAAMLTKLLVENALATYPRLKEAGA